MSTSARNELFLCCSLGVACASAVDAPDAALPAVEAGPFAPLDAGRRPSTLAISRDGRLRVFAPGGARADIEAIDDGASGAASSRTYLVQTSSPSVVLVAFDLGGDISSSPLALRVGTSTDGRSYRTVRSGSEGAKLWGFIDAPAFVRAETHACSLGLDPDDAATCPSGERCLIDADLPSLTACGTPCEADSECQSPSYCVRGACRLRCCASAPCLRSSESCVGANDVAACFVPTKETGGDPSPGCETGRVRCNERTVDAFAGFHFGRADDPDNVWSYGWRTEENADAFHPFTRYSQVSGSQDAWRTDQGVKPSIVRQLGPGEDVPGWLTLHAGNPIDGVDRGAILRWTARRTGTYRLKISAPWVGPVAEHWLSGSFFGGPLRPVSCDRRIDGIRQVDSAVLHIQEGDFLEIHAGGDGTSPKYPVVFNFEVTDLGG